jgi:XTP/dITP diphosphohydrolase
MVMIIDGKTSIKIQGEINGKITETYKGEGGFGYDPLFYIPEYKMTFAEMSSDQKNSISHRGNALKKLEEALKGEDLKCL